MMRMVRACLVCRGRRTVLVVDECRVYADFQRYGKEEMPVAERGSSLALHL